MTTWLGQWEMATDEERRRIHAGVISIVGVRAAAWPCWYAWVWAGRYHVKGVGRTPTEGMDLWDLQRVF